MKRGARHRFLTGLALVVLSLSVGGALVISFRPGTGEKRGPRWSEHRSREEREAAARERRRRAILARAEEAAARGDLAEAARALGQMREGADALRRKVGDALLEKARKENGAWNTEEAKRLAELAKRALVVSPELLGVEAEIAGRELARKKAEALLVAAERAEAGKEASEALVSARRALDLDLPPELHARAERLVADALAGVGAEANRKTVLAAAARLLDRGRISAARRILGRYARGSHDTEIAARADALRTLEQQGGKDAFLPARKALRWLAAHQDPKDGGFHSATFERICGKPECRGKGRSSHDPGVSGMALMAFTAFRKLDVLGEFSEPADRCARYLVHLVRADGTVSRFHYNEAIVALALLERAGAGNEGEQERAAAARIVNYLSSTARLADGGWRYRPGQGRSDVSVTCWVLQALHAAASAGIPRADEVVDRGIAYLDWMTDSKGWTGYVNPGDRAGSRNMTAAALYARLLFVDPAGDPRLRTQRTALTTSLGPVLSLSANHLDVAVARLRKLLPDGYGLYYATYALRRAGGAPWKRWGPVIEKALVSRQSTKGHAAGSWTPSDHYEKREGRIYATALSALTLEAYYR